MKDKKITKQNTLLRSLLFDIVMAAEKVSNKYGRDDQDKLSDWTEWVELRRTIQQAKTKGNL